jgi:undecaprenyl-diphosphatase
MDAIYTFDYSVLNWLQEHATPFFDTFFGLVTHLGDKGLFWILMACVFLCFKKTRRMGLVMGFAIFLGGLFGNVILKPLVHRIRPYNYEIWEPLRTAAELLIEAPTDFSFPSGHTLVSFEASVSIFAFNKKWGVPAIVLAFLIAFSRIYLYVHYVTDVLAGIVMGTAFAIVSYFVIDALGKSAWPKFLEWRKKRKEASEKSSG